MSNRQEYRQHSKSTLLKAAEILYRERETVLLIERRKWRRRLTWAVGGALLAGFGIGLPGSRAPYLRLTPPRGEA